MRVLRYAVAITALVLPGAALGADVLSQLGITLESAKEAVGSVLTAGVNNPGLPAQAFKLMPPAARAQTATAGVAWLKTYVASPDFKRQYAQLRQTRKPEAPTWETTPEQEVQRAEDDQKRQLEESKRAIASLPADQRKAVEEGLKAAVEMTAKMNTPEMRKMRLDGIKASRAAEATEYNDAVAKWKQDYPDDPKPIIVKRLREFLQLSADVDFNAKLKTGSGTSTFENPAYQAKSSQWKLCYRAGREATAAARTAVQAWLTELGQ
jgi:nitrogen fixation protein FixH